MFMFLFFLANVIPTEYSNYRAIILQQNVVKLSYIAINPGLLIQAVFFLLLVMSVMASPIVL